MDVYLAWFDIRSEQNEKLKRSPSGLMNTYMYVVCRKEYVFILMKVLYTHPWM